MSLWNESFFNYYVPDLNEEPPVECSYATIDLNAEPNANVGFDSQASYAQQNDYEFVYDDSKQSIPKEVYEEKSRRIQTLTGKPKRCRDVGAVTARVAAVRARVDGSDEVSSHFTDERGDATLYTLGVLANAGQAERAGAILGEGTLWTRLFDITDLPTYRLLTVEFLSTFRYRAHQAAVCEQEDKELPPCIEFSLGGQHMEISIERFAVHLGIYYEPETVRDAFTQGLTQGEDGVMRAWWAQISDTPFTGHRLRATTIRDPLIRYIHRCIMTTISGRGQSQEWVTTTDLLYLHSLMIGRPCNLARCFALYYVSFYH
ncbi:hypothetical protein R6Q57_005616 [Mikania cordata]